MRCWVTTQDSSTNAWGWHFLLAAARIRGYRSPFFAMSPKPIPATISHNYVTTFMCPLLICPARSPRTTCGRSWVPRMWTVLWHQIVQGALACLSHTTMHVNHIWMSALEQTCSMWIRCMWWKPSIIANAYNPLHKYTSGMHQTVSVQMHLSQSNRFLMLHIAGYLQNLQSRMMRNHLQHQMVTTRPRQQTDHQMQNIISQIFSRTLARHSQSRCNPILSSLYPCTHTWAMCRW